MLRLLRKCLWESEKKLEPRRSVKQVLVDFYYLSTAHGISHAANAPSRKIRVFWLVVFLACMIVMIIQLSLVLQKYLRYEKNTAIQITYSLADFPAVTLCSLNPFKNSKTKKVDAVAGVLNAFQRQMQKAQQETDGLRKKRETEATKVHEPRFQPVYAKCVCEIPQDSNALTSSCIPKLRKNIDADFTYPKHKYRMAMCVCELDIITNTVWYCYSTTSWQSETCTDCQDDGRCPMRFAITNEHVGPTTYCLCQEYFGRCLASITQNIRQLGEVLDDIRLPEGSTSTQGPTTTEPPQEVQEALGLEDMKDQLAIQSKGEDNLIFAVAELSEHKKKSLSYGQSELILKCGFDRADCDIQNDFKIHIDPVYGNCFTFNHLNLPKVKRSSRAGATYDTSDYLPTSEAMGFRIAVHSPETVPFPDAYGYSAPLGSMTSFGIKKRDFFRLGQPYGDCIEQEDVDFSNYLYTNYSYATEGCYRSCLQAALIRHCKCADPRMPQPEGTRQCKTTDSKDRGCMENATKNAVIFKEVACNCPQPCTESTFDISASYATWPSNAAQVADCRQGNLSCIIHYRENAALVQVFYEQLNYETIIETPSYPISSLLSDFGGQLGLWLGLSIISGLEFIMLLYDLTSTIYLDRKDRNKLEKSFHPKESNSFPCLCECHPDEEAGIYNSKMSDRNPLNRTSMRLKLTKEIQPQKHNHNYHQISCPRHKHYQSQEMDHFHCNHLNELIINDKDEKRKHSLSFLYQLREIDIAQQKLMKNQSIIEHQLRTMVISPTRDDVLTKSDKATSITTVDDKGTQTPEPPISDNKDDGGQVYHDHDPFIIDMEDEQGEGNAKQEEMYNDEMYNIREDSPIEAHFVLQGTKVVPV